MCRNEIFGRMMNVAHEHQLLEVRSPTDRAMCGRRSIAVLTLPTLFLLFTAWHGVQQQQQPTGVLDRASRQHHFARGTTGGMRRLQEVKQLERDLRRSKARQRKLEKQLEAQADTVRQASASSRDALRLALKDAFRLAFEQVMRVVNTSAVEESLLDRSDATDTRASWFDAHMHPRAAKARDETDRIIEDFKRKEPTFGLHATCTRVVEPASDFTAVEPRDVRFSMLSSRTFACCAKRPELSLETFVVDEHPRESTAVPRCEARCRANPQCSQFNVRNELKVMRPEAARAYGRRREKGRGRRGQQVAAAQRLGSPTNGAADSKEANATVNVCELCTRCSVSHVHGKRLRRSSTDLKCERPHGFESA